MEWGTPALVFLAITLAVGGACLGFLKKRYNHTHHHLMVFVLVGAVGYLAPLRIQKKAQHEGDDLLQSWMGVSRTFAHGLERSTPQVASLSVDTAQPVLMHVFRRLGKEAKDCTSAAVAVKDAQGSIQYHSLGLGDVNDRPTITADCKKKVEAGFQGQEVWFEERGNDKNKPLKNLVSIVPLRDAADVVQGVLLLDFATETWNHVWLMEQWRIVGEFSGLLIICICLAGFLVVTSENRRRRELEKAIRPLMKDIESLDGMVNSVEGVVWERTGGSGNFTYLSQNADGYFGYSHEKWSSDNTFLEQIVHSEDRNRAKEAWKEALKNLNKYQIEYRVVRADGGTAFVHEYGQAARLMLDGKVLRGILLDITAQRESEATMQDMHKMMVQASRQAGMAEVATGVLHNVGNVLNSLNVGAKLLSERLKKSRLDKLCQATQLLKEHLPSNPDFFINDKKGQVLPGYLADLGEYLRDEQNRLDAAVSDMIERIEHIRDMIMLQQSHSSVRTLWEPLDLATVMEEALRLETDVHITHQQVQVERHYADLPPIYSARGLLLQILVNLLANACQAMGDKPVNQRILTLRIVPQDDRVKISVEDTGCGIHPRHLTNIFTQGFTTKKEGHGFGLHHACLLAQDLGGALKAESDGIGKGARFILDIPARKDSKSGPFNLPNSLSASTLP